MRPFRTLLLNGSYEPLSTISWQRAITLEFREKVDVVERYDAFVHSPRSASQLPAVCRLKRYIHVPRHPVRLSREGVLARDGGCCQYCSVRLTRTTFTLDHVLPRSRNGRDTWDNLVAACSPCNRQKGDRTPEEAGMALLSTPYRPRWLAVGRGEQVHIEHHALWEPWLRAA